MKKGRYLTFCAAISCGAFATTAVAQTTLSDPLYLMPKLSWVDADVAGFDDALNAGLVVGYDLYSTDMGIWSVEGEVTTTISDGDITGGGEWDVDTLAGFGVFRSGGDLYLKAKAGFQRFDIKRAGGTAGPIPDPKDTEFAAGIGGGWRMDRGSGLEVEYTRTSELNVVNAGYYWRF